jgi:hypothetical protein
MVIQPPGMKSKIENRDNQLLIEIPSQKIWFGMLFLPVWLVGWAFGEWSAAKTVFSGDNHSGLFLFVWLIGWTFGGAFALYSLVWMLVGKEKIVVDKDQLSIKRNVFGLGREKIYLINQVRELRASAAYAISQRNGMQAWGFGTGLVAFDYGSSTVRFASSIDEAEAKNLVGTLLTHNADFAKSQ